MERAEAYVHDPIRVPGFVQLQVRRSGADRYAARIGSASGRTLNVGTYATEREAREQLDLARRRIAADLERRLARRGHVGNGWAPVGFLVDEERRDREPDGFERTVPDRRKPPALGV